jgi:hypothetical protein
VTREQFNVDLLLRMVMTYMSIQSSSSKSSVGLLVLDERTYQCTKSITVHDSSTWILYVVPAEVGMEQGVFPDDLWDSSSEFSFKVLQSSLYTSRLSLGK